MIIYLSATKRFGAIGSKGFICSLAPAAIGSAFSLIGLISIAVANCKNQRGATIQATLFFQKREEVKDADPVETSRVFPDPTLENFRTRLLAKKVTVKFFCKSLKAILASFFQEKSHERAKLEFSSVLDTLFNERVDCPKAGAWDLSKHHNVLNTSFIRLSAKADVEKDILKASQDMNRCHVVQGASQYNAAEAPEPMTLYIGEAMRDNTQGPKTQRTNPFSFECVTAFLTHLGSNMLENVLSSAGKTYQKESAIEHGYLRLSDETIEPLTSEFQQNFSQAEYVCYESFSRRWQGTQPVYIMLQAAPATDYSSLKNKDVAKNIEGYAALANYLALFRQGITLAKRLKKPVIVHVTAVGGGVFGNKRESLEWGLLNALLYLQDEMIENKVTLQLEARNNKSVLKVIADNLGIAEMNAF